MWLITQRTVNIGLVFILMLLVWLLLKEIKTRLSGNKKEMWMHNFTARCKSNLTRVSPCDFLPWQIVLKGILVLWK